MQKKSHTSVVLLMWFLSTLPYADANDKADAVNHTLYGKIDISLLLNGGNYKTSSRNLGDDSYVQSNGSRVGFKAEYKLKNGYTVFGQLEYSVDFRTDLDEGILFDERNIYIGLGRSWGKLLIGRNDSPLKLAQGNIDLFSDSDSQMYPLQRGENRVSDVIMFSSPELNNFSIDTAVVRNPDSAVHEYGVSLSLKYDSNGVFTTLSLDQDIFDYDVLRWVGSYTRDAWVVSALVQESKSTKMTKRERGYTLSTSYKFSEFMLKFQYTNSDEIIRGGQFTTVGVDWYLRENLPLYVFYTDRSASNGIGKGSLLNIGMRYKF